MKTFLVGLSCAWTVFVYAQSNLTGHWEGESPSGRPITLELKADGTRLSGALTLVKESEPISEGAIDGETFSFKAVVDGKSTTFTGQRLGEEIQLVAKDVMEPVKLKRAR